VLPPDTLVHGARFRLRWDALERNLLELPHAGFALGADLELYRRDRWSDHRFSNVAFERARTRDGIKLQAYFLVVAPVPGLSERHRVVARVHAGASPHDSLDRFSSFHLGGGPPAVESLDLSRHPYPGALVDSIRARNYTIATLEYRLEVLSFLYLHARATSAVVERAHRNRSGLVRYVREGLHAFSFAVTSGFFWSSTLYLEGAWDTGGVRDGDAGAVFLVVWAKSF
jgi:hypothetical protein